jgi:hypothetical protein
MSTPWYWSRPRSASVEDPDVRVSDVERSQIADALSKHFADGRLDQAEFDERLQQAMAAKTRGDLGGLLTDLPPLVPPDDAYVHRHRGRIWLFVLGTFLFFAAVASTDWGWHDGAHFPWFLFAVVLFFLWRRSRWRWHRHWRGGWGGPVPPTVPGDAPPWAYRRRGWWI